MLKILTIKQFMYTIIVLAISTVVYIQSAHTLWGIICTVFNITTVYIIGVCNGMQIVTRMAEKILG